MGLCRFRLTWVSWRCREYLSVLGIVIDQRHSIVDYAAFIEDRSLEPVYMSADRT